MRIVRFQAAHLRSLELQEAQSFFRGEFGDVDYGRQLELSPHAFTGLVGDRVVACAGVHELWPNRGVAWALLSQDAGAHFKAIHRATAGFLAQGRWRRVEAMVDAGFPAGHRWMTMLGFEREGLLRAYSPDGSDYFIYARIHHG